MQLQGKKINFLGDSITQGHGTSDKDKIFWNVLGQATGATVRGYGIGGTRIARQQTDDESQNHYFRTRVEQMDADADIIVVFGGTNDFGHGNAAFGAFDDRTDDTFYGAMHNLCLSLMEKYPTATIVFMTPLYRTSEDDRYGYNEWGCRLAATLPQYREAINQVASYYGLPVLRLEQVTAIQPKVDAVKARYMPDGLHPNDAGHAVIATHLQGFLESL